MMMMIEKHLCIRENKQNRSILNVTAITPIPAFKFNMNTEWSAITKFLVDQHDSEGSR